MDIRLGCWQDALANVPDGSVRLLLTSPPYDNARTYEGTNEPVDFGELAAFALRVLCPGGVLAMVLDGAVNDGVQSVTPYRVICEWAALPGWRFRQLLVYARDGVPGAWAGGWFRRDHEPLLYFIRDGAEAICNKHAIRERTAPYGKRGHHKRDRSGVARYGGDGARIYDTVDRGSIWSYGNVGATWNPSAASGHPATFAERFAIDAVKVWSNPGDLVCDPFSGSGTVAVACRGLGRRFVGAERVGPCPDCGGGFPPPCRCPREWTNYYGISMHRLDRNYVGPTLEAEPVGPLFSERKPCA